MNKSLYAVALLLVAGTMQAVPPLINGVSLSPYLDEWERTQDIFIQKPLEAARNRKAWSNKAAYGPAIAGGAVALATFFGFSKGWPFRRLLRGRGEYEDPGIPLDDMGASSFGSSRPHVIKRAQPSEPLYYARPPLTAALYGLGLGSAVAGIPYAILWLKNRFFGFNAMVKEEERAQLTRVLDSWSEVKEYFPKGENGQFHKMIEDLLTYRDAKAKDYNTHVDRTIATIKKAVHVHYWEKKKQRPWYE